MSLAEQVAVLESEKAEQAKVIATLHDTCKSYEDDIASLQGKLASLRTQIAARPAGKSDGAYELRLPPIDRDFGGHLWRFPGDGSAPQHLCCAPSSSAPAAGAVPPEVTVKHAGAHHQVHLPGQCILALMDHVTPNAYDDVERTATNLRGWLYRHWPAAPARGEETSENGKERDADARTLWAWPASPVACRGCGKPLLPANVRVADGCPCNSPRGINHGLVPTYVCTCVECDPEETGSSRAYRHAYPCPKCGLTIGGVVADHYCAPASPVAQAEEEELVRRLDGLSTSVLGHQIHGVPFSDSAIDRMRATLAAHVTRAERRAYEKAVEEVLKLLAAEGATFSWRTDTWVSLRERIRKLSPTAGETKKETSDG